MSDQQGTEMLFVDHHGPQDIAWTEEQTLRLHEQAVRDDGSRAAGFQEFVWETIPA